MTSARPTAIIFDCDGVLVDSEILSTAAHVKALTALGYPITHEEAMHRFQGVSEYQMYEMIEADWGRPLPADYDDHYKATIAEVYRSELRAIDGVHEAVTSLALPKAVASNSSGPMLVEKLRHVELYDQFAPHIYSVSDVARGKPAPDLYLLAAKRLGVDPARCIVVEDSATGVRAAKAAGMRVLGFAGAGHCGPEHHQYLRNEGVLLTFDDMRQLPSLIDDLAEAA